MKILRLARMAAQRYWALNVRVWRSLDKDVAIWLAFTLGCVVFMWITVAVAGRNQ